ncbi:MAG: hypothetical protein R3335_14645 [Anaerolineales bacterium]|nr:hypothetical protein [Anaerolineales bacterium]
MNLRNLFRVSAVVFLFSGLLWLVAPEASVASNGVELDPYSVYFLRLIGGYNTALAVLAFMVSGMVYSPARRAVAISFFVLQVISVIVNLMAVFGGIVSGAWGWIGVAFNLVFIVAFGYFIFLRPEESMTPELQPES